MNKKPTKISLYKAYGGLSGLLKSPYLWWAAILASVSVNMACTGTWADLGTVILPALIGFSIASYAIMFSMIDGKMREALSISSDDNPAPMTQIFAVVTWAVCIQTISLIASVIYSQKAIPNLFLNNTTVTTINSLGSLAGLWLFFYSLLLVIAVVRYLFDTLSSVTKGIDDAYKQASEDNYTPESG